MDDQADLTHSLVDVLENMSVPYMIGGSIALNVWAAPRMTHDLDIVVDLPQERIVEFCTYFSPKRYSIDPDIMRAAFLRHNEPSLGMYSFLDVDSGFKADLFPLRQTDPAHQTALTRRIRVEILEGLRAFVYAPDDLLIQKLRWFAASDSERQFRDCVNLILTDLKRPKPLISRDYVLEWVSRLGSNVQQAWHKVAGTVDEAVRTKPNE